MSHADVGRILLCYPQITIATLHRLTGTIRQLCGRIFEITTLPVKHRVHAELLRSSMQNMITLNKAEIKPAPTHVDIANHIGTHREAVSRELTRLRKKGLIERKNNKLIIHDIAQLRAMVQEVTGLTPER